MKIKKSIECWLVNPSTNEVLLLQVPAKKGRDAFFQPITGGLEGDETPDEACLREVLEETGLRVSANDLVKITDKFEVKIDDTLQIDKTLYLVNTEYFEPELSPSEHISFKWVDAEDVVQTLSYQSNMDTWALTWGKVSEGA